MPTKSNNNENIKDVASQAVNASKREDDLIHNDPNPSIWFKIAAFFSQIFKGSKNDAKNTKSATQGDLDNVQTNNNLQDMSTNQKCEKSFENFFSMDEKDRHSIKTLQDANEFGQSLTSTKTKDREREGGFYKLVSEPLNRLASLEEGSEEYKELKDKLISNLDEYMDSHNPHSDIGKARCEFAQRLHFALSKENELDEDDIEDENEDENDIDIDDEKKGTGFLDDCVIVDDKERTSLIALEREENSRNIGVTKQVSQDAPEKEAEMAM